MTVDDILKRGAVKRISGADPAAGATPTITVPPGVFWLLLTLRAQLVTDVTVANRRPVLLIDDGATDFFGAMSFLTQTASQTIAHTWFSGAMAVGNASQSQSEGGLPTFLPLSPGSGARIGGGIQAGDNWGRIEVLVAELAGV